MSKKTDEQLPTNEDQTETGKMEVYKDPPGRQPESLGAKWGDKPASEEDGHGTGATEAARTSRREMVDRIFEQISESAAADRAFINKNFATTESERRTPHSLLLQKQASIEEEELRSNPTLREKVRDIIEE